MRQKTEDQRKRWRVFSSVFCLGAKRSSVFLLLALAPAACRKGSDATADASLAAPPQAVEVMALETMTLRETVGLVGSIAANESAALRAEIPGVIESIQFTEGAAVKLGDPLVKLDTRELEAQLAETRAGFVLAERNLERNQQLLEADAVSKLEADTALAEHTRLRAAIDLLDTRLAKSSIIAPFDGIAGSRSHSVGDFVNAETVLTTIDDLSRLKVEMEAPERYLPNLKPGTTFTLRAATSGPDEETVGEVYFVSSRINENTRSTLVKGYVNNPPDYLKPGMFANITLILRTVEDALVAPETAILSTPRGTVLVVPEERDGVTIAAFTPVRTGLRVPGHVQVSPVGPPLKAGDRIVSAGVGGLILFPGMKLQPVEPIVTPGPPAATDRNLNGP